VEPQAVSVKAVRVKDVRPGVPLPPALPGGDGTMRRSGRPCRVRWPGCVRFVPAA